MHDTETNEAAVKLSPGGDARLAHLSDKELLANTRRLVGVSNQALAELLVHLAEVDTRGIHRTRACSSLYTYCIYELRFSEDAAARRSSAAKLIKRFPPLIDAIANGELHLTGLLILGPHLTEANCAEMLARAKFRTKKELAKLVRELHPLPEVPDSIEPLGPERRAARNPTWQDFVSSLAPLVRELPPGERPADWANDTDLASTVPARRDPASAEAAEAATPVELPPPTAPQQYHLQFTATEEHVELIERAQSLLGQQSRGQSLSDLHLRAMRLLVAELEKQKFAVTKDAAAHRPAASREPTALPTAQPPRQRGRRIPAAIRRAVFLRDEARCTYVDNRGQRCRETSGLELHHLDPFGKGGAHTVENVTLHCRAHNQLAAERDFGREHMLARSDHARHAQVARDAP